MSLVNSYFSLAPMYGAYEQNALKNILNDPQYHALLSTIKNQLSNYHITDLNKYQIGHLIRHLLWQSNYVASRGYFACCGSNPLKTIKKGFKNQTHKKINSILIAIKLQAIRNQDYEYNFCEAYLKYHGYDVKPVTN